MRKFANLNSHPEFISIFNQFNINNNDEFLDIGSGLGLICLGIKQNYNFKKIYGVELNKKTYEISVQNLKKTKNYMDLISQILNQMT